MGTVVLRELTKAYRQGETEILAVNRVNLRVESGDFVAIVGQSGSGKTTLLNLIGCMDRPTSGHVEIDGVDVTRLSDDALAAMRRRRIGFVFQDFNLIPILTAEENILMPALLDAKKPDRAYLSELAELLSLGDRMRHLPSELSGGQRQRIAIARALINRPSILLADEPTGNLDKQSANEIMELLQRVNALGNTIMLVTHDAQYARMCRRRVRISDGIAEEMQHEAG